MTAPPVKEWARALMERLPLLVDGSEAMVAKVREVLRPTAEREPCASQLTDFEEPWFYAGALRYVRLDISAVAA